MQQCSRTIPNIGDPSSKVHVLAKTSEVPGTKHDWEDFTCLHLEETPGFTHFQAINILYFEKSRVDFFCHFGRMTDHTFHHLGWLLLMPYKRRGHMFETSPSLPRKHLGSLNRELLASIEAVVGLELLPANHNTIKRKQGCWLLRDVP